VCGLKLHELLVWEYFDQIAWSSPSIWWSDEISSYPTTPVISPMLKQFIGGLSGLIDIETKVRNELLKSTSWRKKNACHELTRVYPRVNRKKESMRKKQGAFKN